MKMYVCCPICSKTLIQAETIKNGIIKCESCHKRIIVEIDKGKITAVPLEKTGSSPLWGTSFTLKDKSRQSILINDSANLVLFAYMAHPHKPQNG